MPQDAASQARQTVVVFAVTIIDDRNKLQGKSYAKQAEQCFTIVCIAARAPAVTMLDRTLCASRFIRYTATDFRGDAHEYSEAYTR